MSGSFVYTAICGVERIPDNKLNDFKAVLPYPLLGDYEVGLESVFYPFSWTNLKEDSWLEVTKTRDAHTVQLPEEDEATDAKKPPPKKKRKRTAEEDEATDAKNPPPKKKRMRTAEEDEATDAKKKKKKKRRRTAEPWRRAELRFDTTAQNHKQVLEYAFRIRVRAGYYHSVDDLVDSLRKRLADLIKRRKIYEITYEEMVEAPGEYFMGAVLKGRELRNDRDRDAVNNNQFFRRIRFDRHTGKVVFLEDVSTDAEHMNTKLAMGDGLANLLGFVGRGREIYIDHDFNELRDAYQARIDPNPLLFIYTDLIKPQLLGNIEVPLLRVVSSQNDEGKHGRMMSVEFKHVQFVDCVASQISYIRFWMADITGVPIDFADSAHATVMLRLRFRKKE